MSNPVDAAIIKICRAYNYPYLNEVADYCALALKLMQPTRRPEAPEEISGIVVGDKAEYIITPDGTRIEALKYRQIDKDGDILMPGCFEKITPAINNMLIAHEWRDRFLRRGK
jgi:hypothetical protein